MEILQTYGQSLGFGFTAVSNPQSSNPRVVFGVNESATLLVLQIADNDTATLRIGHNYDGYNTHFDWGNTVSSMEAARTVILNFYNSQ
jgi:Ethanolamine utilization protein EutJ (predicted chaperonin)